MVTAPIYKDTYYTTTSNTANYKIMLDGDIIFSGKAYRYPNNNNLRININKICRNYLESDLAELLEAEPGTVVMLTHFNAQRTFNLYVEGSFVESYRFYNDYSYTNDKPTTGSSIVVSEPINGHYVPGMYKLRTYRDSTSSNSSCYTRADIDIEGPDYGYTKQVKCTPYVLYYLNSYGGWDSFVIEGKVIKKDAFTPYQTDKAYDNNTLQFETNKYVNEIKTSYELHTGYLSDEQAANLSKNLIGSLKVYLHNIDEARIEPVLIDDKSVTYQTYENNGRKMISYTINITESQSKIRK